MDKQIHIRPKMWEKFRSNTLSKDEELEFYGHIGVCDLCANQFAQEMDRLLVEPPKYLAGEILERSQKLDVQAVRTAKQTSRKFMLFMYSLKIGFAVAASIFLLLVSGNALDFAGNVQKQVAQTTEQETADRENFSDKLNKGSEKAGAVLNKLSSRLTNLAFSKEE